MQTRAHSSDHEISKPSSYDSPFEEMIREGSVELDRWRVNDRIVHVRFHDIFQRVALSLNNDTGMGATLGRIMYANVEVPDSCAIHRYRTALAVLTVLYCPFPYLSILPARDRRILEIFWVEMMRFFIRGATTLVFISQLARGFVMSAPRYGKVAARLTNRRDAIQRLAKIASPAALAGMHFLLCPFSPDMADERTLYNAHVARYGI